MKFYSIIVFLLLNTLVSLGEEKIVLDSLVFYSESNCNEMLRHLMLDNNHPKTFYFIVQKSKNYNQPIVSILQFKYNGNAIPWFDRKSLCGYLKINGNIFFLYDRTNGCCENKIFTKSDNSNIFSKFELNKNEIPISEKEEKVYNFLIDNNNQMQFIGSN